MVTLDAKDLQDQEALLEKMVNKDHQDLMDQ